jgi:hypothetical protein
MLRVCAAPDCPTLTLGSHCIGHEPPPEPRRFARGRPFPRIERESPETPLASATRQERAARVVLLEGAS